MTASKLGVLVVDDDAAINRLVCALIAQEGYAPRSASMGLPAIEQSIANPPSAVLLDIMLPDISGFDVCQLIRNHPRTMNTPVIMLSALADDQSQQRGYACGATAYLSKPFDPAALLAKIAELTQQPQ